jgi:hypothetical protein
MGPLRGLVLMPCVMTSPFVQFFCFLNLIETVVVASRSAEEADIVSRRRSLTCSSTSLRRNGVSSEVVPVYSPGKRKKEKVESDGDHISNGLPVGG